MTRSTNSILKGLLLLVYPAVQYFGLRLFLRQYLGLRFGFPNTTDYDFLLPAPTAFVVLVYALEAKAVLKLQLQKRVLALNLLATALFLLLNARFEAVTAFAPLFAVSLWFVLITVVALTSFSIFVSPRQYLTHPNRLALLPCVLIATSLYFYMNLGRDLWLVLGSLTSHALHALLTALKLQGVQCYFTAEEALRIDHSLLSVRIGKGCGGGDAFFYFSLTFLAASMLSQRKLRWFASFALYVVGVGYMFVLNIVRILGLFAIGIGLRHFYGYEWGTQLFRTVAHLHIGWILYTVGILLYWRTVVAVIRYISQPQANTPPWLRRLFSRLRLPLPDSN